MSDIHNELRRIQQELKAPKGQLNKFGNYKYRSCEDILEAVKPLLKTCTLTITDEVVQVGDRYYVRATATIDDGTTDGRIWVQAMAREEENKKGMDGSQITGAASSYARKYALNGLFCIDDTKDADTRDNTKSSTVKPVKQQQKEFTVNTQDDIKKFTCDSCGGDVKYNGTTKKWQCVDCNKPRNN